MAFISKIILLLGLFDFVKAENCMNNNQACANMFFPNKIDMTCNVDNRTDTGSCVKMDFIESQENAFSLDDSPWLTIQTFAPIDLIRPEFNVTIFHGGWNHLKLRFKRMFIETLTNDAFHCRDITVSPKFEKTFFYACDWSAYGSEGALLEVQTDSGNDDYKLGKYMFITPQHGRIAPDVNIANLTIFIYIETTDTKYPIAHIQLADSKLNITSYNVTTYKVVDGSNIRVSDRNLSLSDARSNVFRFLVNDDVDDFIIGVVPIDSSGNRGRESWSPIVKKEKAHLDAVKISLITVAALLPVLIFCILLWRYFRKRELERLNRIENEKYKEFKETSIKIVKKPVDPKLRNFNLGEKDDEVAPEVKCFINTRGLRLE